MATIKYFIPEDGDKEEHPNIFMLKKSTQSSGFSPRLRDVKDAFPMPGKYHFRFKSPLIPGTDREKGAVAVWMDCVDNDQRVGVWKNSIFAKVTRISMEEEDEDSDDEEFEAHRRQAAAVAAAANHTQHHHPNSPARNAAPAPQQQHHHHPANPPTSSVASESNLLGVFDEPTPTPRSAPSSGNLFDVPVPSTVSEGSLLDMDGGVGVGSNDHGASADFLGMTAAAPAPQPPHQQQQQQQQPTQVQMQQQQQYMQQTSNGNGNAFNTFSEQNGPFGGLEWK